MSEVIFSVKILLIWDYTSLDGNNVTLHIHLVPLPEITIYFIM